MSSTKRVTVAFAACGVRHRISTFTALIALSGCSLGMARIDPRQKLSAEPTCSDGPVTLDRILGASLTIAGTATFSASLEAASGQVADDEAVLAGAAVSGVAIAAGLLYFLSSSVGARRHTECQMARTRWTHSNAIKALPSRPRPSDTPPVPARSPGSARSWAEGVPENAQAAAFELYSAGNREFGELRFAQALAKYREAIRHWDHPAIRFNIAVCLINLDQPVEARENLERSLAHGVAALGADAYAQALTQRTLLDGKLARLTLDCPEPDQEVMIDGKLVFKGPGTVEQFLLPGEHQVVATKPGFLPASRKVVLAAGASAAFEIRPLVDPRP